MRFSMDYFARALKVKRAELGWSQDDLSERSGVNVNSIARYESGRNAPSLETVCKLADAFGCSLDDFVAVA